jgi:HAE1 family hydrophobic/amphiphilic exporter-1
MLWLFLNSVFLFQITPSGFIPNEDRNHICRRNIASRVHLREHENTVKELDSIIESMDIVEAG